MGTRGTHGTSKKRSTFLAAIAGGQSVEDAAKLIGAGRRTVYNWRAQHEEFQQAWDEAIDACTDKLEAKLQELALGGDLGALIFMLRSRKPATYNPNLLIRQQMLQLALAKARAEASGLLIEGQAVTRPMIYPRRDLERSVTATNGTDTTLDSALWIDAYLEHADRDAQDDDGPRTIAA